MPWSWVPRPHPHPATPHPLNCRFWKNWEWVKDGLCITLVDKLNIDILLRHQSDSQIKIGWILSCKLNLTLTFNELTPKQCSYPRCFASFVQIWWFLAWLCDELLCPQTRGSHTHTHGWTGGRTDTANDITQRPKLAWGKNLMMKYLTEKGYSRSIMLWEELMDITLDNARLSRS